MFYGWVIVASTFVVMMTAYGVQYTFGVMMPAMQADTGWNREVLAGAFALYAFSYGMLGMLTGRLTDRFGPRPVIVAGGLFLIIGYVMLSRATSVWQLYVALSGICAFGMSAAFVPCSATVIRWFVRHRGRALGITMMGASVGNIVTPILAAYMIGALGWRATYAWMGVVGGILVIVAALFVRRDPAALGLAPDGRDDNVALGHMSATFEAPTLEDSWTFAEAQRTGAFWLLTAMFFSSWLVVFLPMVHLTAYAIDLGIDPIRGSVILAGVGVGGVLGRPLVGLVSDKVSRLPALAFIFFLQAAVFVALPFCEHWLALTVLAAIFGFGYGGGTTLFAAVVGDFYGTAAVGAIVGFVFAIAGSSAAFGPWFAGYIIERTGSYDVAFWFSAMANALAFLLVGFLRRPERRSATVGAA
ncbi:MAG: OFA family oxalate/formate antiporter-like MFS transporter [Gammaproteobacteria bacterium]|jgi:OFA family oxalate/formate antiporter-like MFS transporter